MEKCKCECEVCKSNIENLTLELTSAKKQAEENLNLAKYQKAEFENYKKRERAGAESAFSEGRALTVMSFLPVFDALSEAVKLVKDENREGLEMLQRKFESILANFGVTEISAAIGDKFDPYIHNSVAVGKTERHPSGTILEVWQKGYRLDGKVVRATSVKVNE